MERRADKMMNSERFIDLYKVLEDELEAKYRREGRPYTNTVYQFICDKESEPFREKLDLCRQIRNLITHSAEINGKAPVEPASELIDAMNHVIAYLRRPPLAVDYAVKAENLFKAALSDRMMWLMRRMEERGFSHVPVMDNDKLIGVFSISSVFTFVMKRGSCVDENTRMRDILREISPESHVSERFLFASSDATVFSVKEMFSGKKSQHEKRVAAVFITKDGTSASSLIGMITPWDLMGAV